MEENNRSKPKKKKKYFAFARLLVGGIIRAPGDAPKKNVRGKNVRLYERNI